jgi:Flp pilus assembly protein TadG
MSAIPAQAKGRQRIMTRLFMRWLAAPRSRRGNAAIEFAILMPVAAFMLVALLDFGMAVNYGLSLRSATRAAIGYAVKNPADTTGIRQIVADAVGTQTDSLTVTTTQFCECVNGASIACGGACADGSATIVFVQIDASQAYAPIIPYPGIPNPIPLSSKAVFRSQ